jgi:hypothetical protein
MEQQTAALIEQLRAFKLDVQLQQTQAAPALRTAPPSVPLPPLMVSSRKTSTAAKAGDDWEEF